jgi:hypothetical protein
MCWDLILHGFWFQPKLFGQHTQVGDVSKLDTESRLLLDKMFETLKKILGLPDPRTQGYALHGLGHLHHPAVRETVQEFVGNHKAELTEQSLRGSKGAEMEPSCNLGPESRLAGSDLRAWRRLWTDYGLVGNYFFTTD